MGSRGLGFVLQLLIPLNLVDLNEQSFLRIPGPLLGIFLTSLAMVIGIYLVYAGWYKHRAVKLDRSR